MQRRVHIRTQCQEYCDHMRLNCLYCIFKSCCTYPNTSLNFSHPSYIWTLASINHINSIISSRMTLYCFLFFLLPVTAVFTFPTTAASLWNTWYSLVHARAR